MGRRQKLMSADSKLWSLNPSNKLLSLVLRVNDPNTITSSSGPNKNETHPSPQKTRIINIGHDISHCGALLRSLNVYWPCGQSRPISVKFSDKAPSLIHDWKLGDRSGKQRDQALPSWYQSRSTTRAVQCTLLHAGPGRNHADLSPPRAKRRLVPRAPIIFFSAFLSSPTLWPYPRKGSVPKAKEQSTRGTSPLRRAQSSPAPQSPCLARGYRGACAETFLSQDTLLTQLWQDSPWTCIWNPPSCLIQSSGVHLHGFCLMLEAWGGRRFFAGKRLLQHCTIRRQGKKNLTTQSSVIWAQQRGTFRTKHVWNQISAKSLHISSLSRLLTRSKWKCTIRQQREGTVST